MQDRSQYSAAASLLGYIYQCRLALLESIKRLKSDPDIAVAIETLDDVVFEKDGSPTEVIQVKHHIARKASLTNASTDLWKTIRIWCDLFTGGLSEENSILCLMTTEESAEILLHVTCASKEGTLQKLRICCCRRAKRRRTNRTKPGIRSSIRSDRNNEGLFWIGFISWTIVL